MKTQILEKDKSSIKNIMTSGIISIFQVVVASMFLALMAKIAFPISFSPVPISLQTFGVAVLAMTLGSNKAFFSVICYLFQASLGLPVLIQGLANPLWMVGPTAGFLAGFLISAYCVGKLLQKQKQNNFFKTWAILSLNEVIILSLGTLWMGFYFGWEKAIMFGALPYIPGALLKTTMAASLFVPVKAAKNYFGRK